MRPGGKILLADDHSVVLQGMRRILESSDFGIVAAVKDGIALVEAARRLNPDLIITDLSMPRLNGIDAARQIRKHNPNAKIIFFSVHVEAIYAVQAMEAGASAYVLKSADDEELTTAVRAVLAGKIYIAPRLAEPTLGLLQHRRKVAYRTQGVLTGRQRQVLQMLAEGKQPKEIAGDLKISPRTVEFHKYRIMETLGVRTVAEIAVYAARSGVLA